MATVIITGASGGLGKELVSSFLEDGNNLILQHRYNDITINQGHGNTIDKVCGDLRTRVTMNQIEDIAKKRRADVLINNAAMYLNKKFADMTDCEIQEVMDTDLLYPMLLTRKIWALFKANGGGLIVNINSLAGKDGGKYESAYCAAKHGLAGFSKALQFDGTDDNIQVLNVYIGAMNTTMTTGRADKEKFIDSSEAASIISQLCKDRNSLRISEITLSRRNY